jgi:hypothetical protein
MWRYLPNYINIIFNLRVCSQTTDSIKVTYVSTPNSYRVLSTLNIVKIQLFLFIFHWVHLPNMLVVLNLEHTKQHDSKITATQNSHSNPSNPLSPSNFHFYHQYETGKNPTLQLGQGIRNPKLRDSRNHLETLELHLCNSDYF